MVTAPYAMDIVIIGLLLGGTYALMAMGLQLQYGVARIMNLANGEMLIAGAFGTFWFYSASKASPFYALIGVVPLAFVVELGDLPRPDPAAGAARQEPGPARGRLHSGDLRPELHRCRHSARHVRRRIPQLLLSGASGLHSRRALRLNRIAAFLGSAALCAGLYVWLHHTRTGLALARGVGQSVGRRARQHQRHAHLARWPLRSAARSRRPAARCSACS